MKNNGVFHGSGSSGKGSSGKGFGGEEVLWHWQGPEEVQVGKNELLYVWKPSGLSELVGAKGYYALRHKVPHRPVLYAATNELYGQDPNLDRHCCLTCPSLEAALAWCESHYSTNSGVRVVSNRRAVAGQDYWTLALAPHQGSRGTPRQYWQRGEVVPLSMLPDGTEFTECVVDGMAFGGRPGKLVCINRYWTAEVQVGRRWERIEEWPLTTLVCLLHNVKIQKRNFLVLAKGEARDLFYALGYTSAATWTATRLSNRLNNLNQFLASSNGQERLHELVRGSPNSDMLTLLTCISGALNDGATIKIQE